MPFIEKDLEFNFAGSIQALQFDDTTFHGHSSMKRVDFITEHDDFYRFIEVKDPDIPAATEQNKADFLQNLQSGKLINSFAGKYRDSLLFRNLEGKTDKPVDYIVLLSMSTLDPAMLINKIDTLHREIPINHNSWPNSSARSCVILNLEQYKTRFGEASVRRISESGE